MVNDLETHLGQLLATAIAEHEKRKNQLRRANWALRISAMVLGGASTILLGLQINNESYIAVSRNIALAISAILTLIASLSAFWDLDKYWLKRKTIYNELTLLYDRFEYIKALDPSNKRDEMKKIFASYLNILRKHGEYWEAQLNREDGPPAPPPGAVAPAEPSS
ncbi:SLATT domain-containing protein [Nocardia sp. CA-120079]|uniref:SLATT domain-containing protein n=1 Tax=Nocardia sp. CA-120079 TaxID=3239974 RepID=UPI003D96E2E8